MHGMVRSCPLGLGIVRFFIVTYDAKQTILASFQVIDRRFAVSNGVMMNNNCAQEGTIIS